MGGLYDAATLHALLELFRSQTLGFKSVTCLVGFVVRARDRLDANKVGISHGPHDEARNQYSRKCPCRVHTLLGMPHDGTVNSTSFDMLGGLGQQGSLSP